MAIKLGLVGKIAAIKVGSSVLQENEKKVVGTTKLVPVYFRTFSYEVYTHPRYCINYALIRAN